MTQEGRPLIADEYEPNDTPETAHLLEANFVNASASIDISRATCHINSDADYYKINLGVEYTYTISGVLYNRANPIDHSNYTLSAKISYSANGANWNTPDHRGFSPVTVPGGTLYLKIEPGWREDSGTYEAKIDITRGCNGILSALSEPAEREAGTGELSVTIASSCTAAWTAVSNANWITITAGANTNTGSGNVRYSYAENTSWSSRTGTLTIAGQTYTVTQAPAPDSREPNNTVALASLLTPVFVENASVTPISSVNCHATDDVDIYKVELLDRYTYRLSGDIYGAYNQNSNYTLFAKISYSTNGINWSTPTEFQLPPAIVPGGTLYLKIESYNGRDVGTYGAKIEIKRLTAVGCAYSLSATRKEAMQGAGSEQIAVTTGSPCIWTATSNNKEWITITSGASAESSGSVGYSYTENKSLFPRTGTLMIAGQTYTVTQAALAPDSYEPNDTPETARLLEANFSPRFEPEASASIDISRATCHINSDADYYKINLGTEYAYTFRAALYDKLNQVNHNNYTLDAKISYSTNGVDWSRPADSQLPSATVPGGTLYLKIDPKWPDYRWNVGTYAAKIDIRVGCHGFLSALSEQTTWEAGVGELSVTAGSSCTAAWTAVSNAEWIRITSGESATGSGNVRYSYAENTSLSSRTGTLTIAGQTHTVTQAPRPDSYEPNNTAAQGYLLTPAFVENASVIDILSASCHLAGDVDYYKIELGTEYTYALSGELYDSNNQAANSRYTLDVAISYSANGMDWGAWHDKQLPSVTASGGTLYLRIVPKLTGGIGTYAAKIEIKRLTTAGCSYTLSETSKGIIAHAGSEQIAVTTGSTCIWTTTSNVEWITITSGANATGSGGAGYSYTENSSLSPRTGTLTIAGQTYTVTQAPLAPDSYEPNDTPGTARLLEANFSPRFEPGASASIDISSANCHAASDADYYKINLGTEYTYTISAALYDQSNPINHSNYTVVIQISYSTDGINWSQSALSRLPPVKTKGGALYLKIEPYYRWGRGTYAAKIDIAASCNSFLPAFGKRVTWEAGTGELSVTAGSSCAAWAAVSNANWITITAGANTTTGSGNVGYSYAENTSLLSRTGTLRIGSQTYDVVQPPRPLAPDSNEPNNTAEQASSLPIPAFAENVSVINISSVSCHATEDVDIYKITLGAEYTYAISAVLYDSNNKINNTNHTLDVEISYSTDGGVTWRGTATAKLSIPTVSGGNLYLKIEPASYIHPRHIGTYAAKIEIKRASAAECAYSLSAASKEAIAYAGSEQIAVTTEQTCIWTTTSNVEWITITSGANATGSGSVSYSYAENRSLSARTGTLTVASQIYTVTQAPLAPDGYEPNNTPAQASLLTPAFVENVSVINIASVNCHTAEDADIYKIELGVEHTYTISGVLYDWGNKINNTNYSLDVKISYSTNNGDSWSVPANKELSIPTLSGGILYLKIEPYSSYGGIGTYAAKIDILKTTAGCAYSLSARSRPATAQAGSGQVTMETAASCAWTATSNAPWITLASDPIRAGSGNLSYSYTENTENYTRTGRITVAGQTFMVVQASASCTYSLSKSSAEVSGNASEGRAEITTASSCPWTTVSGADWITVSSNLREGSGTVIYSVIANTGAARTGNITIGGQTFTVNQQAVAPCTYSLSKSSVEVSGDASEGTTEVTTAPSCPWTAFSPLDWITVSRDPRTGSGTVTYAIAATDGAERTGTITIAGQTFTVKQSAVTGFETVSPVKIYPNPAKDFVTIDLSGSGVKYASLKMANQLGQVIYETEHPGRAVKIPLKGLASGLYFIFLQGEEKTAVQKLIIND